ncbi:MAG: putative baseplate assembly protein, partial [Haloarculaceae archaeon]
MSLEIPDLDDRTFEDLVAAAVERIPVHTDEWTDHNAHDPGITVLETLAWVAESYGYRLDRVTDRHVRNYLALVGATPREPIPATARVRLADPGPAAGRRLPGGTRLLVEEGTTGRPFTVTRSTRLTGASVARVVVAHDRGRTEHTTANATDGLHFPAFGERAAAGSALYVGFDADPFEGPDGADGHDGRVPLDLHLAVHDADLPAPSAHGEEPVRFEPSVDLAWEYCTDHAAWWDDATWEPLDVLADGSCSLYRGGTVTLAPPGADWDLAGAATAAVLDGPPGPVPLRCRLVAAGFEIPPRLDRVTTNVLEAADLEHRGTRTLSPTGRDGEPTATARPGQAFEFDDTPVLDAEVAVEPPDGERSRWTEVPDFDASGPDDRHYVRDATAGTVTFGDGRRGAVPPAGSTVVAERYTVGGGTAGNVTASARWTVEAVPAEPPDGGDPLPEGVGDALAGGELAPLAAAADGRDAETTAAALRRAREERRRPYRCVTLADYEAVAAGTPGLRIGRTTAWV